MPDATPDLPAAVGVLPPEIAGTALGPDAWKHWREFYKPALFRFLREFCAPEEPEGETTTGPKYEAMLKVLGPEGLTQSPCVYIDLRDVEAGPNGDDLADFIQRHFLTLRDELDEVITLMARDWLGALPKDLAVRLHLHNGRLVHTVRSLRCEDVGSLTAVRGTVTRTSDVRSELLFGDFACDNCGTIVTGVRQQFKYTEPTVCPVKGCGNRSKWHLVPPSCAFGDWQKMRLQENASEIPAGSMPRSIDAIVRNTDCDRCKPGDQVILSGSVIAVPDVASMMKPGAAPMLREDRPTAGPQADAAVSGLRKLGVRDLSYKMSFLACHVRVVNVGIAEMPLEDATGEGSVLQGLPLERQALFHTISQSDNCLSTLTREIAPNIYGHEEVKKGILLMMVGGVEKTTEKDGIRLRGDLNVCIVGDPGVAKSQILKFVQSFAPRAVYASGKSSTAAGLTASVHKDQEQGDTVIEAGALMLADKGICCIDEFDKMDEKDMIGIHEAMEQQTISISKAGIHATLNARASVLAACNPHMGRYDASRTFKQNVRLSAPILSRFDLLFVMLDDTDTDELVSRHILKQHSAGGTEGSGPAKGSSAPPGVLAEYIRVAKQFKPALTKGAKQLLVRAYSTLRHQDTLPGNQRNVRVTVRQLESLVRLSEAVARLRFSTSVDASHVSEAYRVFNDSLTKLRKGSIDLDPEDDDDLEDLMDDGEHPEGAVRNPVVIDAITFDKISSAFIGRLREVEAESGVELCVAKEDLITWYLEHMAEVEIESEEELARVCKAATLVLNRMIHRDLSLLEEDVEREEGPLKTVRLHPNLAPSDQAPGHAGRHASLGAAFFSAEQDVHADLEEEDFLNLVYGSRGEAGGA